jgi:hypothetical protein
MGAIITKQGGSMFKVISPKLGEMITSKEGIQIRIDKAQERLDALKEILTQVEALEK